MSMLGIDNNIRVQIPDPITNLICINEWRLSDAYTVKCRYNAVFGVQEIDRVIAVTAL